MSNSAKILVVVEGQKREKPFLERIFNLYGIDAELYVFQTNIYNLYQAMENMEFNGDLKDVLAKLRCMKDQDLKTLQETRFAYTYLIFDCDVQHTMDENKDKNRSIDEIVEENFRRLEEMVAYFTDETDPSIGKLYVNYPMMESYRDCNKFFDEEYRNAQVCIDAIKQYKASTGQKKLASIRVDKFSKENFADLLRMNIYKLNFMLNSKWESLPYQRYRCLSEQKKIALCQVDMIAKTGIMNVLNTTLFLLADYYGNRNGFYDAIMADMVPKEQNDIEKVPTT